MNSQAPPAHGIPRSEWATAAVGLVIVVAILAALVHRAVFTADTPPKITIKVLAIEAQPSGYLVRTRVTNGGTMTAAQVVIEGVVTAGVVNTESGREERSQVTIDYVPAGSERNAGLMFSMDPRRGQLQVRTVGFQDP